ncbi:MAG: hypothetical protein CMO30_15570 [Tistrella sp.]|jgi:hypothetical protein|uniref:Metallo-beta-lactamase domain-containing protein n=1 Tax=Tistrella mobilis TaxID=171437 RepID=A0A3B9IGK8_9PROT|nr:hypothetical protein [Tistrella sp.]MAD38666.1 hypothetical protein [Tistrella sp.]MBA76687.1 hypothetical protein [Tistrella sp.]HAE46369.1 hypothetical protein [Tistrella mobilis]
MTIELAYMDGMWCGQGMAHLLRLYTDRYARPDKDAAEMMALFDFGNSGGGLSQSKEVLGITPPVRTLIEALELQMAQGKPPKLDLVLFSHQDTDHWTLTKEFLDQVATRNIPLEVGRIQLGGTNWGPQARATIGRLAKFLPEGDGPVSYLTNASDYGDANGDVTETMALGPVSIRTIVSNVPSATKSQALIKNGSSAVAVVQYGQTAFILPGDATYETLDFANTLLQAWTQSPLPNIYMMSAPHHGSLDTMTRKNIGDKSDLAELNTFVELTLPYSIFASAGYYSHHKHPYLSILVALSKHTGSHEYPDPHGVVAYEADTARWTLLPEVDRNVYTTVLDLDPDKPLQSADWLFWINDQGHFGTDARFFEGGARQIIGVPQTDSTTMILEEDGSGGGGGGGGDGISAVTAPPGPLRVGDVLPGLERGHLVRSRQILARQILDRGRAASTIGSARPIPPPRRVRPRIAV